MHFYRSYLFIYLFIYLLAKRPQAKPHLRMQSHTDNNNHSHTLDGNKYEW